jgi:DNA-binding NarL/FixJ family response regulator
MIYGYDYMLETAYTDGGGALEAFYFTLVFALSMIVLARRYGRDPDELSKIAHYTTPAALLATAVFALLPEPLNTALYLLSPVLFAPAMVRRVYGVLYTSGQGSRITRYMAGIAACVTLFTAWMIAEPPKEIAFLIVALLSLPAWIGIRRIATLPDGLPAAGAFRLSRRIILLLVAAVAVLLMFNMMNTIIHTNIINAGIEESNPFYMILGFILPLVGFVLYGFIHDKGHEWLGFICGMGLCIIGVILALVPSDAQSGLLVPLAFTDGLGGTYTEFFILTIPVFFLQGAKRPVFAASLGVIANLISSAFEIIVWGAGMPESLMVLGTPLFAATAILAVIFIVLVSVIFERHREKTLAAALHAMMRKGTAPQKEGPLPDAETPVPRDVPETQKMIDVGLTIEEIKVAQLLIEGETKRGIERKLKMSVAEVNQRLANVRDKVIGIGHSDPAIAAAATQCRLTSRETEVLTLMRQNAGNGEIAAAMFISDETVKTHIRNVMKKIPVEKRQEIPAWLETFEGGGD